MNSLQIQVNNNSGRPQKYVITQDLPSIDGLGGRSPWGCIIQDAKCPPDATAAFVVDVGTYYAYATTSNGKPSNGSGVSVSTRKPVSLGRVAPDGSESPGSTAKFIVQDGTPDLDVQTPGVRHTGAFAFQTGDDFTKEAAKTGNFLIGFGNRDAPFSLFVPQPQMIYQIYIKKILYLTTTSFQQGSLVDVTTMGKPLKIDFEKLGQSSVKVVQDPTGQLVIEE